MRPWPVRFRDALEVEDYLLLAAVLGLPWAFGGVEIWAYRGASLLVVAAAAVAVARRGWREALGLDRGARWLLPAALLGAWAVIQLVPLPSPVVRVLSPTADALYRTTFPGYPGSAEQPVPAALETMALERVPEVSGVPAPGSALPTLDPVAAGRWQGWRPLSLRPAAGLERVFWYAALLVGFLVARRRVADPEVWQAYRQGLFADFLALAVFGLVFAATSNGKLYWVRPTLESAEPFGPFVNPTNFAALMELAVPWMAGYALLAWRDRPATTPLRESRLPLLVAAVLLCVLAALGTASKGAAVLVAASLAGLALAVTRGWRARVFVLAGTLALVGVVTLAVRHVPLGQRMREFVERTGGQVTEIDRLVAWRASLPMLRDYAVTGAGFGAFRDVFPAYLPEGEFKRWRRVHNDYLEVALDGGAVGLALLAWLAVAFWRRALAATRREQGKPPDYAALGLVLGLLSLSAHAFFDFNHQIPAVALMFITAGALALAARGAGTGGGAGR